MSFRVSSASSFYLFQRLFGVNGQKQARLSEQLATGKKINRPSDDPNAVKALAAFKENLGRLGQFERNLHVADRNWKQIESSVSEIHSIMDRARELAIQGNNGTLSGDQRDALAEEVAQLSQQLLTVANTRINGEYIHAGYATDAEPFTLDPDHPDVNPAATYNGSTSLKSLEIAEGQSIEIQIRMDQLLMGDGNPDTVDVFQTLANLEQALRDNNIDDDDAGSVGQALEDLGIGLLQVEKELAAVGGKTNRIDRQLTQLTDQKVLTESFIEGLEKIDPAEAIYEFQQAQIALQATVGAAGAVLNQPSLMSFLR